MGVKSGPSFFYKSNTVYATLDLIEKASYLPDSKGEETSDREGYIFQRITGKDPRIHVLNAADLGMGKLECKLIEIKRKTGKWDNPFSHGSGKRISLMPKVHGWHREWSKSPHPCMD